MASSSANQPVQGQSIDTGANRYVSNAVDDAEHADDEKEAGEGGEPIQTKKRKAMSDEEKLERRKRLKEEHELSAALAEAAKSSSSLPPSSTRARQPMRAQALWWKK